MEVAEDAGDPLGLPKLICMQHLPEAMIRLGPVKSDGMGERPADWPEIDAFTRSTGRIASVWEAETLFDMCKAYHHELRSGSDPFKIAPVDR